MIKSICIVRLSALGDVLMLVPLIRTIQAHDPTIQVTWVISMPAYELVQGLEHVEFIVIDKPRQVKDYWRFWSLMKNRCFDVLLATQASMRANLLYPLIKARRKIGYDPLRAKDIHGWFINESIKPGHDHTLDGFLRFAQAIGIKQPVIRWDLSIGSDAIEWAKATIIQLSCNENRNINAPKRPVILINPAASKPERSWLPERYALVIDYLKKTYHAHVILVGGPSHHDKALGDEILKKVTVPSLIGKTELKQLLALISEADLLI